MKTLDEPKGFTLIELLTVIAIVGVLAAILIPTITTVRTNANIAVSRTTLSQYVSAILAFKGEYGYFPFIDQLDDDEALDLNDETKSTLFIETLSGRDAKNYSKVAAGGNRRMIEFYEFAESEFHLAGSDLKRDRLADRFNNTHIVFVIDKNGDGVLEVPNPDATGSDDDDEDEEDDSTIKIRSKVTAYVKANEDGPAYYLYD